MLYNTEKRPDIGVGIDINVIGGMATFVARKLFPWLGTTEKGGKTTFAKDVQATGTTNRAAGVALVGTRGAGKEVTWGCDRYEGRVCLTDDEVLGYGTIENAIVASANGAAYGAIKNIEKAAAAKVFTAANYTAALTMAADDPFSAIAKAATTVKKYGKPTLVCSEDWFIRFCGLPEVRKVLVSLYGEKIILQVQSGIPEAVKACGIAFGVKEVLIGDDAFWSVENKTDAAAVVGLRDEAQQNPLSTAKTHPTFGVAQILIPQGGDLAHSIEIETAYDSNTKDNITDATAMLSLTVINGEAVKLVKLPATGDDAAGDEAEGNAQS